VRGLVLFLAVGALIGVLILLSRRMMTAAGVTAMLAGLMILWFFATDEIPEELVFITAPVLTLVVLVVAGRSLRPPKYDGYVWRRGESG
jgi:general nucleoside transport system permease protein